MLLLLGVLLLRFMVLEPLLLLLLLVPLEADLLLLDELDDCGRTYSELERVWRLSLGEV